MDRASFSRLRRKSLEEQFVWELEHSFELSPKEAEAILLSARTILCRDGHVGYGKVRVIAVGIEEPASKSIEQMRKVEVVVTVEGGQEDLEVLHRYGPGWLRCIRILRMTEEAIEKKREFYSAHDPTHFPHVAKLWARRARFRPIQWTDGLDVREIGKHGTVTY